MSLKRRDAELLLYLKTSKNLPLAILGVLKTVEKDIIDLVIKRIEGIELPKVIKPISGVDYPIPSDGYTPKKNKDYFDGKNGHTPKKGIDYFDGHTPQKGKDYFDGYTPIKGKDYFDGEDGYIPQKGKDYFDGEDGSPDTGGQIVGKINELEIKAEVQIDADHIKNLEIKHIKNLAKALKEKKLGGGGGGGGGAFNVPVVPTGAIDGSNRVFTLPFTPRSADHVIVVLNGFVQKGSSKDYSISGKTLTYDVAPPSNSWHFVFGPQ